MGEMKRAIAREEEERRNQDRFTSTVVIAAATIAAVRLARDDVSSPSPRINAAVADSVSLARKILQRVIGISARALDFRYVRAISKPGCEATDCGGFSRRNSADSRDASVVQHRSANSSANCPPEQRHCRKRACAITLGPGPIFREGREGWLLHCERPRRNRHHEPGISRIHEAPAMLSARNRLLRMAETRQQSQATLDD